MGLGPPVCTKCMTILDYDESRIGKSPWYCSVHGDESNDGTWLIDSFGEKTRVSHTFCYPKEQADIIAENTRQDNIEKNQTECKVPIKQA